MLDETAVHILGGGIGGTVGAVVTCPLEVVKVRLQSSQGSALRSHSVPVQPNPVSAPNDVGSSRRDTSFVRHVVSCASSLSKTSLPQPPCPPTGSEHGNSQRPLPNPSNYQVSMTTFLDTKQNPTPSGTHSGLRRSVLLRCIMDIGRSEGYRSLFKGLLPTLVGVLPSRGVYFCAYHKGQVFFEGHFPAGSSGVYLCAAGFGSIAASSLTNPIWFVKTRLQLDSRPGLPPITVGQVIRSTWRQDGFRGFYRGVSASYVGSLETALNFVIYENVKAKLLWWDRRRQHHQQQQISVATASSRCPEPAATSSRVPHVPSSPPPSTTSADLRGSKGGSKLNASSDMMLCMLASAFSKAVAITATYPHEVVRTRLREAHGHYRGLVSTVRKVTREEGLAGLYRGMGTHYIRQVPNSCIMIGTYEMVVFLIQSWGWSKTS
ncbi:hypothetical protein P879_08013 [Paragonimus westermani]|uniref:Solute carrier family 25, member 33/36 n=1 Tax=Paragonimus westermani TaxID=34504 RepID=A0A8T0CZG2_9TREM|nr:hypothetical protein P879_08013 [Paragonimus westermani]